MLISKTNLRNSLFLGASVVSILSAPAMAQKATSELETVVVTGTRVQGMTAADSAAPVTVLGTSALTQGAGTADIRQALGQTVPSFTAESSASDSARLNLNAALRGLSPNDTLVMVNGKRRHGTANLNVSSANSFAGGAAPDGPGPQPGPTAPPPSTAPTPSPALSTSSSRRIPRAALSRPRAAAPITWTPMAAMTAPRMTFR